MARAKLLRSGHCLRGAHDRCPHFSDVEIGALLRPRPRAEHLLTICRCGCHASCPLAAQGTVLRETWQHECACPGAEPVRAQQERAEERRQETADVLSGLRHERQLWPDEIETRLRASYLRRGEPSPAGLAVWAKVVAAGTARPGTRTPRLLGMGIRTVARTVSWAWRPADGAGEHNRAETRKLYRGISLAALLAALLTTAAVRSSGSRRLYSAVGAALAWLTTIWVTALGTFAAQIAQVAEKHPSAGADDTQRSL